VEGKVKVKAEARGEGEARARAEEEKRARAEMKRADISQATADVVAKAVCAAVREGTPKATWTGTSAVAAAAAGAKTGAVGQAACESRGDTSWGAKRGRNRKGRPGSENGDSPSGTVNDERGTMNELVWCSPRFPVMSLRLARLTGRVLSINCRETR